MGTSRIFRLFIVLSLSAVVVCLDTTQDIVPDLYKLEIIVNLGDEDDAFNFKGTVWIDVGWNFLANRMFLEVEN